jgi:hypothetical protein
LLMSCMADLNHAAAEAVLHRSIPGIIRTQNHGVSLPKHEVHGVYVCALACAVCVQEAAAAEALAAAARNRRSSAISMSGAVATVTGPLVDLDLLGHPSPLASAALMAGERCAFPGVIQESRLCICWWTNWVPGVVGSQSVSQSVSQSLGGSVHHLKRP